MRTLYDVLMSGRFDHGDDATQKTMLSIIRDKASGVPVIEATNVAEYYFQSPKELWHLSRDFPNIAPPFEKFWIETRAPSHMYSDMTGTVAWSEGSPRRWGACFTAKPKPWGWDVNALLVTGHRGVTNPLALTGVCEWAFRVSSEGAYLAPDTRPVEMRALRSAIADDADPQAVIDSLSNLMRPFLLAVCFMHCRNVTVREVPPPRADRRRAERGGGYAGVTYHVLDIAPMQAVLNGEGGAREHGVQHALHICRGHFKRRKTGTFWWGAHVRGSAERGVVVKDYNVKAPETKA